MLNTKLKDNFYAKGRLKQGEMNDTEKLYAKELERRLLVGEILKFDFEAMKFRLADKTFYTPDFMVMARDQVVELHEVKPHQRGKKYFAMDDAKVKIKVAAARFPFRFFIVWPTYIGWQKEEF